VGSSENGNESSGFTKGVECTILVTVSFSKRTVHYVISCDFTNCLAQ